MSNTSLLGSYGGQAGDGLLFRNRIVNGCMRIDQRNAGAAVANANGYVVDRFFNGYFGGTTGRFSAQRSTTAPAGFSNSLLLTTTTAQASLGANDGLGIIQHIEGFNVSDLAFGTTNAQTVTVSFWIRSSQTGTLGVILANSAANRTYGALVTINSANTFEYKTVTIPGDITGTWATDNTAGISLFIGLGGGSSRTISAGWSTGLGGSNPGAVTGQTINLVAVNSATLYITGVQLEAGPVATPFERRPIGTEIQLAQRYYYRQSVATQYGHLGHLGVAVTTGVVRASVSFPVTMRAAPTMPDYGNVALDDGTSLFSVTTATIFIAGTERTSLSINSSGLTSYRPYFLCASASGNGYLGFSAEL